MKQVLTRYGLVLALAAVLLPGRGLGQDYRSTGSGTWTTATVWSPAGVPPDGTRVAIGSGHTITCEGDFTRTSGAIVIAGGGTLIVKGSFNMGNSVLDLSVGSRVIVQGNLTTQGIVDADGFISITGNMTVNSALSTRSNGSVNLDIKGNLSVGSDINMQNGYLHVGGDLSVGNQLSTTSSTAVVDVDGSVTLKYLYTNAGYVIIDRDLTLSAQFGSSGITVCGGEYKVQNNAPTYVQKGHFFVFGSNNCANGDCQNIEGWPGWLSAGRPGAKYFWWKDHLGNAGTTGGPSTACGTSTFSVAAVTDAAGDLASNTFEWAAYGAVITAGNGGTTLAARSGTIGGHTASVLTYAGIPGQTTYTITVQWTETTFADAYVAVRQTTATGCSDDKWSVYKLNVSSVSAPAASSPQEFCSANNPAVADLVATGSAGFTIKWYRDLSGGSPLSASDLLTDATTYYASQTSGACESGSRTAVTVVLADLAMTCPPAASAVCFTELPVVKSFKRFFELGGSLSGICSDTTNLTINVDDVITLGADCKSTRTFRVLDNGVEIASCDQACSLTDREKPTLTCGADQEVFLNASCGARVTIAAPSPADNCSLVDPDPSYSYYPGNETSLPKVEGKGTIANATLPIGTTTIYWSIADGCGNTGTCGQQIIVRFPITYDGNSTQADNGPGMNPVQTSTHTYRAVDDETDRTTFSYDWQIFGSDGSEVTSGFTLTSNGTPGVSIRFADATAALSAGSYVLQVTKNESGGGCSVKTSLPIRVWTNDFDVQTEGEEICQSAETGTTRLEWTITMKSDRAVAPFSLTYQLVDASDNAVVCGPVAVTEIRFSGSGSFQGSSSCTTLAVNAATSQIYVTYLVANTPGVDKTYRLELFGPSDAFQVSDPIITNNSAAGTANSLPATSSIQID